MKQYDFTLVLSPGTELTDELATACRGCRLDAAAATRPPPSGGLALLPFFRKRCGQKRPKSS